MEEIWKDINGFKGYLISNLGRVKSYNRGCRILNLDTIKGGYKRVMLYNRNTKEKVKKLVHVLVFEHFGEYDNKFQINHIDNNPSNNCISNLELCTAKYNMNYGKRKQFTDFFTNYRSKPILELNTNNFPMLVYKDKEEVAKVLNCHPISVNTAILRNSLLYKRKFVYFEDYINKLKSSTNVLNYK